MQIIAFGRFSTQRLIFPMIIAVADVLILTRATPASAAASSLNVWKYNITLQCTAWQTCRKHCLLPLDVGTFKNQETGRNPSDCICLDGACRIVRGPRIMGYGVSIRTNPGRKMNGILKQYLNESSVDHHTPIHCLRNTRGNSRSPFVTRFESQISHF